MKAEVGSSPTFNTANNPNDNDNNILKYRNAFKNEQKMYYSQCRKLDVK